MSPDEPAPQPPHELLALFEAFSEATTELCLRMKNVGSENAADSSALMLEYQSLLAKHVDEVRRFQDYDGMSEYIAEMEAGLAQMREVYTPRELSAAELELQNLLNRLANRQGTKMPDFDALYRKKADLDRRFMPRPDVPPRDGRSEPNP